MLIQKRTSWLNFKSLISLNGTKVEKNIGYSVKLKKDEISWSQICLIWTLIICRGDVLVVLIVQKLDILIVANGDHYQGKREANFLQFHLLKHRSRSSALLSTKWSIILQSHYSFFSCFHALLNTCIFSVADYM